MNISVTGSMGFIGSHLVKKLEELGRNIVPLDILNGIDLTDWNSLQNTDEFDVLIHLAAKTYVPDSYKYPREFYNSNILGTLNALELCRIREAKMIFTSSYVYGKPEYLPIDEKHPTVAFNPYANSKIIGEKLCEGYNRDFGVSVIILRLFNIYGAGQNRNFLIPSIIEMMKNGKVILNDPSPRRDFVYIDDVIDAYIKASEYNSSDFEVFNIGYGKSHAVQEVVDIIGKHYHDNIEIEYTGEKRRNEIFDTVADITKARELLGWQPEISLKNGINRLTDKEKYRGSSE